MIHNASFNLPLLRALAAVLLLSSPLLAQAGGANAEDAGPSYRSLSPPTYPQAALEAQQEGHVLLNVLVGADGVPVEVKVEASEPSGVFDADAIAAVKTWRFNPATQNGQKVPAWVQVPVCFARDESASAPACSGGPDALDGIYRKAPKPGDKA